MKKIAVIPARYASTRLPGKPLRKIAGIPMIIRVYNQVKKSELFDEVIIATDDERILKLAEKYSAKVMITSSKHKSGTDRIAEVSNKYDAEIIVNIQGDEPFISKKPLQDLLECFMDKDVQVVSLMHKENKDADNENVVKVVCDKAGFALYFSRAKIPFSRVEEDVDYFKHIGVYGFRKNALKIFVNLPQSRLEKIEKLEQLRLLENGIKIKMVETAYNGFGIDTEEDLIKAEEMLR